jgi:hypothetical protein
VRRDQAQRLQIKRREILPSAYMFTLQGSATEVLSQDPLRAIKSGVEQHTVNRQRCTQTCWKPAAEEVKEEEVKKVETPKAPAPTPAAPKAAPKAAPTAAEPEKPKDAASTPEACPVFLPITATPISTGFNNLHLPYAINYLYRQNGAVSGSNPGSFARSFTQPPKPMT